MWELRACFSPEFNTLVRATDKPFPLNLWRPWRQRRGVQGVHLQRGDFRDMMLPS